MNNSGTIFLALSLLVFECHAYNYLYRTMYRRNEESADPKTYDNSWCFKGLYDIDNCPEKNRLHDCVRCCSEIRTYYNYGIGPSRNVCLAACADKFPKLIIKWTYL